MAVTRRWKTVLGTPTSERYLAAVEALENAYMEDSSADPTSLEVDLVRVMISRVPVCGRCGVLGHRGQSRGMAEPRAASEAAEGQSRDCFDRKPRGNATAHSCRRTSSVP